MVGMLHLKFSLNLEDLADELIKAVKDSWGNPFQAPVIIFPDPKLEQWFRLHWVKKCGTLANLNSMMIDKFLLKILHEDDNTKKKLNADLLRNVIWAYLYGKEDVETEKTSAEGTEMRNYHLFGDEVVRYLETDGKLDEQHLFDLCGKIAALFLEYETSRPAGFIPRAVPATSPKAFSTAGNRVPCKIFSTVATEKNGNGRSTPRYFINTETGHPC